MMTDGTLVQEVVYDWFFTGDGDEYKKATTIPTYDYLGRDGKWHTNETPAQQLAQKIVYHEPRGDGDRHYVDIYWPNGSVVRMFNLSSVTFMKETE